MLEIFNFSELKHLNFLKILKKVEIHPLPGGRGGKINHRADLNFAICEGHCPEGQIVIWTAKLILLLPLCPELFWLVRTSPYKPFSVRINSYFWFSPILLPPLKNFEKFWNWNIYDVMLSILEYAYFEN